MSDWKDVVNPPCVVLCGGKGTRFAAEQGHKSMAEVEGMPIIHHVIEYWSQLTNDFIFVVKHGKEPLVKYIETLPIKSRFVEPKELKGIADGLSYASPYIDGPFFMVLGDCFYSGEFELPDKMRMGLGVVTDHSMDKIKENYSVIIEGGRIKRLVEKPKKPENSICGTGFYFLQKEVFEYIEVAKRECGQNELGITEVLQGLINQGEEVYPVYMNGLYVNVNRRSDVDYILESLSE
ncbi:MAG TPA: hypothetical protein DCF45_03435 [Gammaproteobacteria bacterium]|nr:hypothetical protein [Gammaproteobacteria bacterium]